ncbi:MAG TPA: twin-arginine translocase subunit TatC [Chloroflexota bacterium]|nr:twin-arginine translocase subunit TatC [Chloroflexota bacterium]
MSTGPTEEGRPRSSTTPSDPASVPAGNGTGASVGATPNEAEVSATDGSQAGSAAPSDQAAPPPLPAVPTADGEALPTGSEVSSTDASQAGSAALSDQAAPPPPPAVPTADGASPSPEDEEEEGMTMLEHLEELRMRVIITCVALAVGLAISAIPVPGYSSLTWKVIAVVNTPAEGSLQAIKPGEVFITYFKVALIVGAALAMPVIIYQVMAFVMPALHPHEKKYLFMAAPGVTISFLVGVVFGYVVLLPFAIKFLLGFGAEESGVDIKWSFGEYIGTVTTLLFWMGMSFETPLIMFFLTKLRVLSVQRLARFRKYAFVGAFIIGAIITPTPDPFNQTIVSIPLYLLFELGILMAKLA